MQSYYAEIVELIGKTFVRAEGEIDGGVLLFIVNEKESYRFYHSQSCCECVYIQDIIGNLADLVGTPLLMAEEVSGGEEAALSEYDESYTWTFYKFATLKGYVTVRWYGSSNGWYGEEVDFERVEGV